MYLPEPSESWTELRLIFAKSSAVMRTLVYLRRSSHAASSSGRGFPRNWLLFVNSF
jgi:hypothetical protein